MFCVRLQRLQHSRFTPLILVLWLMQFVGTFGAADLLHSPQCEQNQRLRWATHHAPSSVSAPHAQSGDEGVCAMCAVLWAAQGNITLPTFDFPSASRLVSVLRSQATLYSVENHFASARAPPASPTL